MTAAALAPTIRSRLTRTLFWRMVAGLGLLSLLALAALHLLLARQRQAQLERRVVKLTDIVVKAHRDGAVLAERLAEYAPRRPGTRLVATTAEGRLIYEDPDLPAHTLSPHVRRLAFVPSSPADNSAAPRIEITIDISEHVELERSLAAMLLVITLGPRWVRGGRVPTRCGAGWRRSIDSANNCRTSPRPAWGSA